MSVSQICDNLWQVGGAGFSHPEDAAVYLLVVEKHAVLIDAGTGLNQSSLIANIAQCLGPGIELSLLLLTHCHFDHAGGAQGLKDRFGCQVVAHSLDAVYLEAGDSVVTAASWYGTHVSPLSIDVKLDGAVNPINVGDVTLSAIHCPGHSPGSLVYTYPSDHGLVLFGQDIHGPIHPDLLSDDDQYQKSLARLAALDADWLLEGHYGVIKGKLEVSAFIRSFMQ
jgi:glyoxylase-like metal-dependent hydrolase (beta-lactamase superfamily II)